MLNDKQRLPQNLNFKEYRSMVMKYVDEGILPENISILTLLEKIPSLAQNEKSDLQEYIINAMPQDGFGESVTRSNEWIEFFSNPFAGKQKNSIDEIKKRAEQFLPLLHSTFSLDNK